MSGLVAIYFRVLLRSTTQATCAIKDTTLMLEPRVCGTSYRGFDRASNQAGRVTVQCRRR
jgi:hypothetical protein